MPPGQYGKLIRSWSLALSCSDIGRNRRLTVSSGSDDAVGELGGAKIIGCRCDDRPGRLVGNVGGVSLGSRGVHGHQEEDQDRALGHVNLHAQVLDGSIRRRNLGVAAPESEGAI